MTQGWSARLAVVGTSFRRVGFGRMAGFVVPPDAESELATLKQSFNADELIYVATCNRVECYLLLPEAPSADTLHTLAEQAFAARGATVDGETFFVRTGREALEHLFRVVSSLDSLVVGETEISGQAKRACERATRLGLATKILPPLFERAIGASRRVRAETGVGSTFVSVATIALQKIRKHFGKEGPGVTVLVGVGDMTRKVAQALSGSTGKRIVVNRTRSRAEAFCAEYGGVPSSLEAFKANPPGWVDLIFTATSADEAVVTADDLAPALAARKQAGVRRPLIVVDLGLPRDVDRAVDQLPGVVVVAMEHLEALSNTRKDILEAESAQGAAIVAEEVDRLVREDRFRSLAGESAEALISSRLTHLSEDDRETLLRFATGLAGRIARQPLDLAG